MVKICSSSTNQNSTWTEQSIPWPTYVKQAYPSWYPIDGVSFNHESARLMLDMFFGGLQDMLLDKKFKEDGYKRASERHVKFMTYN